MHQLKSSGSKALFTCLPLLPLALEAAAQSGIAKKHVYLLTLPKEATGGLISPPDFKTVDQLIEDGASLPPLEKLKWEKGQGARQTAFLCYSSGTSGLPKGVMISHRNVISNTLQIATFEKPDRDSKQELGSKYSATEVALGLLPQSHIYSLVVICHATTYRGDQVIILPKFEMGSFLNAIQRFRINTLFLVSQLLHLPLPKPGYTYSSEEVTEIIAIVWRTRILISPIHRSRPLLSLWPRINPYLTSSISTRCM